ncbi:MAG: glycosyltransferase family 2 protein [Candidatus Omnitrophica bacterium]|nr:glycosyltransferase family 2 protein [Candidatus Omnitrophota bacterium]
MRTEPLISIVIVNYNGKEYLLPCLESVFRSAYPAYEVILVDNASTDGSIEEALRYFSSEKRLRISRSDTNELYTGGYNIGIRLARGEYVVCLNNDTEVDSGWLREIALIMQDAQIGAAVPKILVYGSEPARIDYCGAAIDRHGFAVGYGAGEADKGQFDRLSDVFYAGGTAMVLRRSVLGQVGLFDPKFGMHWEETDLSWRIRLAGYRIVVVPGARVYHKGSLTMKRFSRSARVSWYIKKNRLAGLIKNYGPWNLLRSVPCLVLAYLIIALRDALLRRDIAGSKSSLAAISWNIKELPYLLRQRRRVQKQVRRVKDKEVVRYMYRGSLLRTSFGGAHG